MLLWPRAQAAALPQALPEEAPVPRVYERTSGIDAYQRQATREVVGSLRCRRQHMVRGAGFTVHASHHWKHL